MDEIFKKIDTLSLEKSEPSMLGRFTRAFLEADNTITKELFSKIDEFFNTNSFQSQVISIYTKGLENEKSYLEQTLKEKSAIPHSQQFYKPMIDLVTEKLKIKNFSDLMDFISNDLKNNPGTLEVLNNTYRHTHRTSGEHYIKEYYKYYYLGGLLYDDYLNKKGKIEFINYKYANLLINEYSQINIDLQKTDTEFDSYKLLSLNEHIRIRNDKDSQTLVDNRIGKYFWIKVPRKLLFTIEQLINEGYISKIAFRVDFISKYIPAMEEMEYGSALKIKIDSLPDFSKFYSVDNYDNKLWIYHDKIKSSLTFEEHIEDFEIIEDNIITQVIHLEYQIKKENYIITHIDHEFILYTIEEYEKRLIDPNIKGHRKIKTFKVDQASIPFNYEHHGEHFLYQVLDAYLKNTDLINEYFAKI